MNEILKAFEIIGTIAFSVSGGLMAIGAGLDLFGVMFVSCITAFGGGIVRDLLLGLNPPAVFHNFPIFMIAFLTSFIVFIVAYIKRSHFSSFKTKVEYINNFFDAIGLAAFTVIGSEVGYINGFSENGFIIIVIGMLTGIGGGIFRDILIDTAPFVFKKHVYAVAAICGSFLYYILRKYVGNVSLASVFAMVSVILLRLLATHFRWRLPKIDIHSENT